jgi:hypothetical protein
MVTVRIQRAEGFHKFLVSILRYDGSLLWAFLLTAEETEKTVKNFCDAVKGRCDIANPRRVDVDIVAEKSALKECGLLRVKEE